MGGRGKTKGKYRLCVTEEFKAARVPLIACQPNNRIKFEQSLGQHHLRREEAALMPLLPPEVFVWPEELLVQPLPAGETGRWWALHSRPRAEKTLARHFLGRGLAFFLPLAKKRWRNRGRLFTSTSPLFPGYIFLWGDH